MIISESRSERRDRIAIEDDCNRRTKLMGDYIDQFTTTAYNPAFEAYLDKWLEETK